MRRLGIVAVGLALVVGMVGCNTGSQFRIEGSTMEPTLPGGTVVKVSKYGDASPQRGDIIVFRFPGNPDRLFIKRIIGEPGDTVEIKDGTVYIDGNPLDEPYLTNKPSYVYGPTEVPPKQYFVLGDNRNNSYDSHVWGFLPEENVVGRVRLTAEPTAVAPSEAPLLNRTQVMNTVAGVVVEWCSEHGAADVRKCANNKLALDAGCSPLDSWEILYQPDLHSWKMSCGGNLFLVDDHTFDVSSPSLPH